MQPQPLGPGILIAFFYILLAAQNCRHQAHAEGNLLGPGEQVVVAENGRQTIEGGGDVGEVKAAVGAWRLHLVENHRVAFPLQTVFDIQLLKQLAHVAVSAEKDVQAGLIPVSVFVLPGRHLAAQHIAGFHHHRRMAGITEVLRARQPGEPCSGNDDAHTNFQKSRCNLKGGD